MQVAIAVPCPYHVPTVLGGAPVGTSRIPKHVPVFDILAAAHTSAVGVVMMLTRVVVANEAVEPTT